MKTAMITGSAGQDGVYLSKHLQRLGYKVIGVNRGSNPVNIVIPAEVFAFLKENQPDEIYHLAAVHHSSQEKLIDDLDVFRRSNEVHTLATANLLEGMTRYCPKTRLFFAASCHVFGSPPTPVQNEMTPMNPEGIYGITKLAGLQLCQYYRRQHKLFACVGILYNHESPLRAANFVSKRIVAAGVAIQQQRQDKLVLGDLDAAIDWGFAGDYVDAMHRILQLPTAEDFVISSGQQHRVRDFAEEAFRLVGLDLQQHVSVDPLLLRQRNRSSLFGNNTKLQQSTGWRPQTDFPTLVRMMVTAELEAHPTK
jgi:GDPmannose 4,6-dehydratase